MNRLPSMRAVVAFEVVARHGSFGKAADELYVTISAVSHQIAALDVTSRTIIWRPMKEMRVCSVPFFHGLERRFALEGCLG